MHRDRAEGDAGTVVLEDLVVALGVTRAVIVEYVELGLVAPGQAGSGGWSFSPPQALRLLRAVRLARDLELHPAAAALLVELLEERDELRRRIVALQHATGAML